MAFITIESSNYNGQTTNITFYPFTGGTINLGTQVIPYTRETENYEGTYEISIPFYGSSCGLQIGASPCVDITGSNGYDGMYEYLGEGYLTYSSKVPDDWTIVCDANDPKSQALYFYRFDNGIQTSSWIMGNVYESFGGTQQVSIVKFINYNVGISPCNTSFTWPATLLAYPTYNSNGIPSTGSYGNPGPAGGTYTLTNNPSCILPSPTPTPSATLTPTPSLTPTLTPTPTTTSTPTPTPSASVPAGDPDAAAYLADVVASGGTTDATIESAVNTLFTSLKSAGLYSKITLMYPMVGGVAASHAINAKLNKSYDITWVGGMTHSSLGAIGNGTNSGGNTHFLCQNQSANRHMATYITTGTTAFGYELGGGNGSENVIIVSYGASGSGYFSFGSHETYNPTLVGDRISGNLVGSISGTSVNAFKNGTQVLTNSPAVNNRQNNKFLSVLSDNRTNQPSFTPIESSIKTTGWVSYGDALTDAEMATYSTIINTFQTSLGRNIY